jgi:hypothetical protein
MHEHTMRSYVCSHFFVFIDACMNTRHAHGIGFRFLVFMQTPLNSRRTNTLCAHPVFHTCTHEYMTHTIHCFSCLVFHTCTHEYMTHTIHCFSCLVFHTCTHEYMTHTIHCFSCLVFHTCAHVHIFCSHSCIHEHAAHIYFGFHSWLFIHEHMNTRRAHPVFHTYTHEYITSQPCCATHAHIKGRELACSTSCVSRVHRLCVIFIHAHMILDALIFGLHTHMKDLFFMHVHT